MRAEELMINDWVQIDIPDRYAGATGQIKSLWFHQEQDAAYFQVFIQGKFGYLTKEVCSDDLRPIPLTPEILEKNGWKRQSFGDMVFVTKKPERRLVYHADNMLTITRDDSTYERRKRKVLLSMFTDYVHEFQHRLKECGIKDDIVI